MLRTALADVHTKSKAQQALNKLYLEEEGDYHTFFTEFSRLLVEAEVDPR